ncbi:hypothetical protein [Methylocella sp.]|uniref:hypothetical protein n=1 Tax=Methylocella sp. TaxID=1978226 RepID=UPI0037844343
MDSRLEARLDAVAAEFRLTRAALDLVRLTLRAIEDDAPPRWLAEGGRLDPARCQELAVERLPALLHFVRRKRGTGEIGVFDLLEEAPQIFALFFVFKYP